MKSAFRWNPFRGHAARVAALITTTLLLGAGPAAHAGDTQTRYPVVLVHGLFGFGQAWGVIDYFWGIPSDLRSGGAKVYIAEVSSVSSNEARGEQLLSQINTILATTGAQKVNIIAHSQGSITARYVAGVAPGKVASVTTIGGPHQGSKLGDAVVGVVDVVAPDGSPVRNFAVQLVTLIGKTIDTVTGKPGPASSDPLGALRDNSTAGMLAFNQRFPEGVPTTYCGNNGAPSANGVRFYSWAGNKAVTNIFDPFDWLTTFTQLASKLPNDGLNEVCTQRFGTFLGEYPWNHFDEINQIAGLRGLFSPSPVKVYHQQVANLKKLGL